MTTPESLPISLILSLEQTSATPPTMRLTVTNTSDTETYTLLTWSSPLDPLALALGLVTVAIPSPDNEKSTVPFPIPQIMLRRVMPPPMDAFVTLSPGESASNEVVFRDPVVDMAALVDAAAGSAADPGNVKVFVSAGNDEDEDGGVVVWKGKRKENLMAAQIESLGRDDESVVKWKPRKIWVDMGLLAIPPSHQ
ncbi:hypothetical protein B0H66DRAFT_373048 [Apodospora peruviana]|uniref:Uncharacterized protein n=1 Tax=Apodospora peruviana TaxID=516989 RepID=A0AAE0HWI9_9PEZI|nr:hypothetical protein B0H66DRAFT_373048 [Apodospora peruviana]